MIIVDISKAISVLFKYPYCLKSMIMLFYNTYASLVAAIYVRLF